jgi:hypothetical protein
MDDIDMDTMDDYSSLPEHLQGGTPLRSAAETLRIMCCVYNWLRDLERAAAVGGEPDYADHIATVASQLEYEMDEVRPEGTTE